MRSSACRVPIAKLVRAFATPGKFIKQNGASRSSIAEPDAAKPASRGTRHGFLRQLRYFVGIVQAGSLSRAADQLHVAQSAISHHLAQLESEIKKPLVTRGSKGIALTEAGTVLYRHAEAILRHIDFAKQDAMTTLAVPSGRVAIGFPSALLEHSRLRTVRADAKRLSADRASPDRRKQLVAARETGQWPPRSGRSVPGQVRSAGLRWSPLPTKNCSIFRRRKTRSRSVLEEAGHPADPVARTRQRDSRNREGSILAQRGLELSVIGEIDSHGRAAARGGRQASATRSCPGPRSAMARSVGQLHHRRFADFRLIRPVALCVLRSLATQSGH